MQMPWHRTPRPGLKPVISTLSVFLYKWLRNHGCCNGARCSTVYTDRRSQAQPEGRKRHISYSCENQDSCSGSGGYEVEHSDISRRSVRGVSRPHSRRRAKPALFDYFVPGGTPSCGPFPTNLGCVKRVSVASGSVLSVSAFFSDGFHFEGH